MSLEETIRLAEEIGDGTLKNFCFCAEEHRQIAEWLRELKRLKERNISDDAISREDALMSLTGEWKESRDELIAKFARRIKKLPPVTPKDDRKEAIDSVRKLQKYKVFAGGEELVSLDKVIAILEGEEPE